MSKLITDSVIELNSDKFGLLPTRRQIDWDGGYVNGWNTKDFYEYVRSKSSIVLERDHAGPLQGNDFDSGYISYTHDSDLFDIIHIDPWRIMDLSLLEGSQKTANAIKYLYYLNPNIKYEIGTEQSIWYFSAKALKEFLKNVIFEISPVQFNNIEYVVIQSGVKLDLVNRKNIGVYDDDRLKSMIEVVKLYGKKCKEHNGDYLSNEELDLRFECGVDSINIGPEIAQIQTLTYLDHMSDEQIDDFYEICFQSKKWEKWVDEQFDIDDKRKMIQVCGHYCFHLYDLPKIDDEIKENIKKKLNSLP